MKKGFLAAYHMNIEHWLTALLDNKVPEKEIYELMMIVINSPYMIEGALMPIASNEYRVAAPIWSCATMI